MQTGRNTGEDFSSVLNVCWFVHLFGKEKVPFLLQNLVSFYLRMPAQFISAAEGCFVDCPPLDREPARGAVHPQMYLWSRQIWTLNQTT
jgi:hypothetical protein